MFLDQNLVSKTISSRCSDLIFFSSGHKIPNLYPNDVYVVNTPFIYKYKELWIQFYLQILYFYKVHSHQV